MNKIFFLIVLALPYVNFAQPSFSSADQKDKSGYFGSALYDGSLSSHKVFKKLLTASLDSLPFRQNIISNMQNFSLDIQNDSVNFNLELSYFYQHPSGAIITNRLVYAYEEVKFYSTYTAALEYLSTEIDYERFELPNRQGYYLWNEKEKVAYYVYPFNEKRVNALFTPIPGLLLTISFPKNQSFDDNTKKIIIDTVLQTDWDTLENLYSSQ